MGSQKLRPFSFQHLEKRGQCLKEKKVGKRNESATVVGPLDRKYD